MFELIGVKYVNFFGGYLEVGIFFGNKWFEFVVLVGK